MMFSNNIKFKKCKECSRSFPQYMLTNRDVCQFCMNGDVDLAKQVGLSEVEETFIYTEFAKFLASVHINIDFKSVEFAERIKMLVILVFVTKLVNDCLFELKTNLEG